MPQIVDGDEPTDLPINHHSGGFSHGACHRDRHRWGRHQLTDPQAAHLRSHKPAGRRIDGAHEDRSG
jgi:hypothetical protein